MHMDDSEKAELFMSCSLSLSSPASETAFKLVRTEERRGEEREKRLYPKIDDVAVQCWVLQFKKDIDKLDSVEGD